MYYQSMTERKLSEQVESINIHQITELRVVPVHDDILLRPLEESDADSILGILDSDPSIRDRVSVASKIHTPTDVADQVEAYRKDDHLIRYAIIEDKLALHKAPPAPNQITSADLLWEQANLSESSQNVIGLISFWRDIDNPFDAPDSPNDYGFGYFLSPEKRGTGIITEYIQRLMYIATRHLHVESFIAYCEKDNQESIAVLIKLGFHLIDIQMTEQNNGWVEYKYVKEVSSVAQIE